MISIQGVSIQAGAFALEGVSLEIPQGGYGVLMGKTGCGKTTVLEAVCGLRRVKAGRILLAGRDVTDLSPGERGIGYVPQDRALFQTMTVRDHLAFGPSVRRWEREAIERRVQELAALLGIEPLLDRRPHGLSGGEAQRVALGRALAARPEILCLDEPLSALDDETRDETIALLQTIRKHTGVTALHVTHSREEARRLANGLFVLRGGAVRQVSAAELEVEAP